MSNMKTAEILKNNYRELMAISNPQELRSEINAITNGCQVIASVLACNCLYELRHAIVDFIFNNHN